MEVHTHNLSNAGMPGYKRLQVSSMAFSEELGRQVGDLEKDSTTLSVNHTQGALRATGRSLDFAIEGKGFFVVADGPQEYLTRNGSFRVSSDGRVVNTLGMPVQTVSGDLQIPSGVSTEQLEVDQNFNVRVDGQVIGTLRIDAVESPTNLEQVGTTLFINSSGQTVDSESKVINGHLEQSNSTIFEEMVGMMTTLRNYEACQKMLRTVDEADEKMMNKLG